MNEAQRRRDAALRRLRLTNRGGLLASLAGAVVLIGLAHQATPVGASRRAASQDVTRMVRTSGSHTRGAAPPRTHASRKIRPAEAPTTVRTNRQSGIASVAASSRPAPVTPAASSQSTPSATQGSSAGSASSSASTPTAPVTSGGS